MIYPLKNETTVELCFCIDLNTIIPEYIQYAKNGIKEIITETLLKWTDIKGFPPERYAVKFIEFKTQGFSRGLVRQTDFMAANLFEERVAVFDYIDSIQFCSEAANGGDIVEVLYLAMRSEWTATSSLKRRCIFLISLSDVCCSESSDSTAVNTSSILQKFNEKLWEADMDTEASPNSSFSCARSGRLILFVKDPALWSDFYSLRGCWVANIKELSQSIDGSIYDVICYSDR